MCKEMKRYLPFITRKCIKDQELLKHFFRIESKSEKVVLWGRVCDFPDIDFSDWKEIDASDYIYHDVEYSHFGRTIIFTLMEEKPMRRTSAHISGEVD